MTDEHRNAIGEEPVREESAGHGHNGKQRLARGLRLRKGIYLVPSVITAAAFFCGFYAIIASINGDFYKAAWAIIFAMFFDGIDGRIARATGATSNFGVEFDSLSDLVAFGAAPAILMYNWVLQPFGRIGWMAAFLFMLCGALRLARFNIMGDEAPKDRFIGMPIPPAAGLLACTVLLLQGGLGIDAAPGWVMIAVVFILALLMVSNIRYHNLKTLNLRRSRQFHILISVILFMCLVIVFPHYMLFAMAVVYAAHGPVMWLRARKDPEFAQSLFGPFNRSGS